MGFSVSYPTAVIERPLSDLTAAVRPTHCERQS